VGSTNAWTFSTRRSEAAFEIHVPIGYVDLKQKRLGYPSVMHFEGRLTSGPEEIYDLFAEFIQRTYTDDI
jgi:hypothetical protein